MTAERTRRGQFFGRVLPVHGIRSGIPGIPRWDRTIPSGEQGKFLPGAGFSATPKTYGIDGALHRERGFSDGYGCDEVRQ
jgi:hypothetical protein